MTEYSDRLSVTFSTEDKKKIASFFGLKLLDWAEEIDQAQMEMHYRECVEWIDALEKWIVRRGLEVPNWSTVKDQYEKRI